MSTVSRASLAVLLGVALAAFALTAASADIAYPAAAKSRAPARAAPQGPVAVWVTATELAYFKIAFPPTTDTFTIMLTDTAKIQEARDIVSGVQTDATSVMGTIVKAPRPYNPYWSYHLDPPSISFFENAIEVCDAAPRYVEEHLSEVGEAFLPGSVWCPWSSRVVAELELHSLFLPIVWQGQ